MMRFDPNQDDRITVREFMQSMGAGGGWVGDRGAKKPAETAIAADEEIMRRISTNLQVRFAASVCACSLW